jgi:hypothetical protein
MSWKTIWTTKFPFGGGVLKCGSMDGSNGLFFDDDGEHDDAIFFELDIHQIHHPSIQQIA